MDWDLLVRRVNEDRLVARHGAGSSFNLLLRWGEEDNLLQVHDGRLAAHREGPFVMPQCDFALAGGVNLLISPQSTIATCRAHMLSADGHCKTFDASADGVPRGEGWIASAVA